MTKNKKHRLPRALMGKRGRPGQLGDLPADDHIRKLLDDYGEKSFRVTKEWEVVTPEHVGQKIKYRFSQRSDKYTITAYVIQEPFKPNYVECFRDYNCGFYSFDVNDVKLANAKKPRKRRKKSTK